VCQLHTTVAMTATNQSYRALNGQFIPPKSWNKLCTYPIQFLYDSAYCLTNNFISDLKTIKFESSILGQFLHTVLSLKRRIKKTRIQKNKKQEFKCHLFTVHSFIIFCNTVLLILRKMFNLHPSQMSFITPMHARLFHCICTKLKVKMQNTALNSVLWKNYFTNILPEVLFI
jgi:hypothetical protein